MRCSSSFAVRSTSYRCQGCRQWSSGKKFKTPKRNIWPWTWWDWWGISSQPFSWFLSGFSWKRVSNIVFREEVVSLRIDRQRRSHFLRSPGEKSGRGERTPKQINMIWCMDVWFLLLNPHSDLFLCYFLLLGNQPLSVQRKRFCFIIISYKDVIYR